MRPSVRMAYEPEREATLRKVVPKVQSSSTARAASLGFLLVSIPIFFPVVVTRMGYDPIWFGCILCVPTTLGAVTPPVGISAYAVSGMSKDIPLGTIFRGVGWFIPAYWVVILLMLFYPQVALFLPSFVK